MNKKMILALRRGGYAIVPILPQHDLYLTVFPPVVRELTALHRRCGEPAGPGQEAGGAIRRDFPRRLGTHPADRSPGDPCVIGVGSANLYPTFRIVTLRLQQHFVTRIATKLPVP